MIKLDPAFTERIPRHSRRGRRIWSAPLTRKFPKRWAIRIHVDRFVVDRCVIHADDLDSIKVTWISLRHLHNSRGYTLKHRVRRRVRRILWGVTA
jgi:hypothetical protein